MNKIKGHTGEKGNEKADKLGTEKEVVEEIKLEILRKHELEQNAKLAYEHIIKPKGMDSGIKKRRGERQT